MAPKITSFHADVTFNNFLLSSSHVDSWIKIVVTRNADKMSLIVIGFDNVFPDFFFTNSSVKQLSLDLRHCGNYNLCNMIPKCTVLWTLLRNFFVECCSLPDESLANILSGCPMLERLVLFFCQKLHHLDLIKSLKLTRLEIIGQYYGPSKIVTPHIRHLKLLGSLEPCTLVDASSLTDARFTLFYIERTIEEDDFYQDMVLKMLENLQNVEKLTIGPSSFRIRSLADTYVRKA
ncbi:hypothetical protein N665_0664s0002 [Sinapis alba]|nr:hypothetical protein N665_0664s0002 [Sinapis alba]